MRRVVLALMIACGGPGGPGNDVPHPVDPAPVAASPPDAAVATPAPDEVIDTSLATLAPAPDERWLRGTTHVHARPSGDSRTPVPGVIAWYEAHGYDFIVLTDHNRVSEIDPARDTTGQITLRAPDEGLIVFAGAELTHNPRGCLPAGDPSGRCRIHVNVLGATARPEGKLDWADRKTRQRVAKYESALVAARALGGLAQVNHPQWFWGMTPDVLVEIARRGIVLYEVANVQFMRWNAGDANHPSTDALWDAALTRGARLWAVASDDAHSYGGPGRWPAGGGWIAVKATRDPRAILDAIAAGRFYASTGVELVRAEVDGGELVVEAVAGPPGYAIELIENGVRVARVEGRIARRALPASGYVRAVVTRGDGARAWVQPAWR